MTCGLNSSEINTYPINGCDSTTVIVVTSWVDETIPPVLVRDDAQRGDITCLPPKRTHDILASKRSSTTIPGRKLEC